VVEWRHPLASETLCYTELRRPGKMQMQLMEPRRTIG